MPEQTMNDALALAVILARFRPVALPEPVDHLAQLLDELEALTTR
jgi:hypothetical protein